MRRTRRQPRRRSALLALLALTIPPTALAQASDSLPPAAVILARHLEAIGGQDALLKHRSRHLKLLFKGPFASYDVERIAAAPNRFRDRAYRGDSVTSERGSDGELVWEVDRHGPRLLSGLELATAREEAAFYADLYDSTRFATIETIEIVTFDERSCYQVRLVPTVGREWLEYFDVATGIKRGSERTVVGESLVFTRYEILSDYRPVDGVLLPMKWVWTYPGWPYEQVLTVRSVEFDGVPDSVFTQPAQLAASTWPAADRLASLLELGQGHVVADVGAGDGAWALELARRVGPGGHVFATELDPELLEELRKSAIHEGLTNVSPVLVDQSYTGLASRCCGRILLRFVYHEFTDPAGMNASLLRALQPGGLIAVVDVLAEGENLKNGRGEHAIVPDAVIQEMVDAGFEAVSKTMNYDGHSNRFAVVLRRPQ